MTSRFAQQKTLGHDKIHRWMSDNWNRQVVCFRALKKYRPCVWQKRVENPSNWFMEWLYKLNPEGFFLHTKVKREAAIFNGSYQLGAVDMIIEATLTRAKSVIRTKEVKEFEYEIFGDETYKETLVCEFKPDLNGELTNTLQQIHRYEKYIKDSNNGIPVTTVLVTNDIDHRLDDDIIRDDGIYLYRIEYEDQNVVPARYKNEICKALENGQDYTYEQMCCTWHYPQELENGFRWEEYNEEGLEHRNTYIGTRSCPFFTDLDQYEAV